ncbi:MAG: abortive infection family protein [Alteromonas stellipolaris]|uniref:abortive infection family protein n=1 Tax=Alteromonas stellipolaris TaxID=233316 RepID=UPI003B8DF13D
MSSLIEKIKNRSESIKNQRNAFVSKLEELNNTLSETLSDIDVWAQSEQKTLKMIGPDDWIYGHLSFSEGALKVVYRSTEDDFHDSMNQVPEEYQTVQTKNIKSCPIEWLECLSSEKQINSLLSNIEKSLASIERDTIGSIDSLNKALDSQSEEVANETTNALKETNSEEILRVWLKARSSIQSDPSDSITRSSSYLESVCRLVLKETNTPLPNKKDITNLVGSAVKALDLSDNSEANKDMIQLFGGVKSIFSAVGSMRTHFGTAHGFTPGDYVVPEHYARLINDASATASTYLLRRMRQKLNKAVKSES